MSDRQADQTPDPWEDARTRFDSLMEYTQHRPGCSFDRTDYCSCGLHDIKVGAAVDRALVAERQQHQQTIQQQAAQIATLAQALEETIPVLSRYRLVAKDRAPVAAALQSANAALSGASRPTEGEQGAPQ